MTKGSACLNLCSCNVNNYPANPFICLNFHKHKRELPTHSFSLKGDKAAVTGSALSHSLECGTCRKRSLLWLEKWLPKGEEESRGRGAGGGWIPGRLKTEIGQPPSPAVFVLLIALWLASRIAPRSLLFTKRSILSRQKLNQIKLPLEVSTVVTQS